MSETGDTLHRAISGRMLSVLIIGDILGAGIYALVGTLANHVGGMVWLPLAIGFVLAALTASSYAELVGKYPRAAGAALYAHRAFNRPFLTFIVAFAVLMSGVASASAAAIAFGGKYLQTFVEAPATLAGLAFLAVLSFINFIGISESMKVNLVLTIVEVLGLVIVIVLGAIGVFRGLGDPARALSLDAPDGAVFGLIGATALGFYALIGFEDSVNLAEECEDPQRSFPRGLLLGVTFTSVIYVTVSFLAVTLVPPATLAGSSGPLLDVVRATGVTFPPELFSIIALLAIGNTALLNMIMASRLLYGMANENILPAPLAKVHAKRKTPYVAIAFTTLIAAGLVGVGSFKNLANTTVLLLLLVFGLVNIAVLVLRKETVDHAHYRTPTWAAVLGALATLLLASPLNRARDPEVYGVAAALVGIGALLWLVNYLVTGRKVEIDAEKLVK
jgi:basic amino acid/polyamine antiporter, APA family